MRWLAAGVLAVAATGATAQEVSRVQSQATAGIRIGLPSGAPVASVSMRGDRVELDLPSGSRFPDDFAAASNGLLRGATVENHGDRLKIELQLASGQLRRVDYEPDSVVLHFGSRYLVWDEGLDPEDNYILNPILFNEFGEEISSNFSSFTGTDENGQSSDISGGDLLWCDDWTNNGPDLNFSRKGSALDVNIRWAALGLTDCRNVASPLYCFQVGL